MKFKHRKELQMCHIVRRVSYCTAAFVVGCAVAPFVPFAFAIFSWIDSRAMPEDSNGRV